LCVFRKILLLGVAGLLVVTLTHYFAQDREARGFVEELTSRWEEQGPASGPASPGDVVGWIEIPRIGLSAPVVEMANVDDRENLNKGPAHLAGTAYPGEEGNCVIAGHRTTHSRPFFRLDELSEGDRVILSGRDGSIHTYLIKRKLVVNPDEVWVMEKVDGRALTLIACHPLFSARKRLVVRAESGEATEIVE
jgi:LPXTG-site transpeptidase (sortase) family protein